MNLMVMLDLINFIMIVLCAIMTGVGIGIYKEISNYRSDIRKNMDSLEKARIDIRDNFNAQGDVIQKIDAKINDLEMFITSRR